VKDQYGRVTAKEPEDRRENFMSGQKGTDGNWDIAVSEYGIALISKKGSIPIS
jgi:hypothetical protein